MSGALHAVKQRLREQFAAQRRAVPPDRAAPAGEAVRGRLEGWRPFLAARRVALYAALPDELPTRSLFEGVVASGRPALLPRILPGRKLDFCPAARWGELRAGRYGVLTPPADAEPVALEAGDLVLVPGLAFDLAGGRLGQGGGYYDRAFASDGGPLLCGVAYAFQLIDAVPCNSRDRRMDAIVTDRGLHEITENQ